VTPPPPPDPKANPLLPVSRPVAVLVVLLLPNAMPTGLLASLSASTFLSVEVLGLGGGFLAENPEGGKGGGVPLSVL
jgi:hypothetical protein